MTIRFITGHLAADPEVQQAGRIKITKFTVLENTYEYRGAERIDGKAPLAHNIEAKFELGENAASSLRKGHPVIVIGQERDASFDGDNGIVYRRIIDAQHIGPDLRSAIAAVTPRKTTAAEPATESTPEPAEFAGVPAHDWQD